MQETLSAAFRHLWRAQVAARGCDTEFTVFVDAPTREAAHRSVRHVVAAICPQLSDTELDEAYYNLSSAPDLVSEGLSANIEHRLFETGWQGNRVVGWVMQPVFAVNTPSLLFQAWVQAQASAPTVKR